MVSLHEAVTFITPELPVVKTDRLMLIRCVWLFANSATECRIKWLEGRTNRSAGLPTWDWNYLWDLLSGFLLRCVLLHEAHLLVVCDAAFAFEASTSIQEALAARSLVLNLHWIFLALRRQRETRRHPRLVRCYLVLLRLINNLISRNVQVVFQVRELSRVVTLSIVGTALLRVLNLSVLLLHDESNFFSNLSLVEWG